MFRFPSLVSKSITNKRFLFSNIHSLAAVQKLAPVWTAPAVVNNDFVTINSKDYLGKWLVLFFYPLDFTFVCPTEIIEYSERSSEFEKLGASVVGVSVDSKFSHLAWINQPRKEGGLGSLKIPLVSDLTKVFNIFISNSDYGVLLDDGIAARGTFIVDPKGIIRERMVKLQLMIYRLDVSSAHLKVIGSIDETLRLLEGYQFADKHGEVCPAGWKKGAKSMIPDTQKSKEYFKSVNE
ncbi:peroxiredoxin [Globomyces sp. JEL0801]|nr:peroxiredoxin [Globomyces sp. JEL0801]